MNGEVRLDQTGALNGGAPVVWKDGTVAYVARLHEQLRRIAHALEDCDHMQRDLLDLRSEYRSAEASYTASEEAHRALERLHLWLQRTIAAQEELLGEAVSRTMVATIWAGHDLLDQEMLILPDGTDARIDWRLTYGPHYAGQFPCAYPGCGVLTALSCSPSIMVLGHDMTQSETFWSQWTPIESLWLCMRHREECNSTHWNSVALTWLRDRLHVAVEAYRATCATPIRFSGGPEALAVVLSHGDEHEHEHDGEHGEGGSNT